MLDKPDGDNHTTAAQSRSEENTRPPIRTPRGRSRLWPAGVHVAPFLSTNGRFVLVAIGRSNLFMVAAEVSSLHCGRGRGTRIHPDLGYPAWILEPQQNRRDGTIPFLRSLAALNGGRPLETLLWPRGVHYAPWRDAYDAAGQMGLGRPMLAIDSHRRLVAEMIVPDGSDPAPVRRDLLAILEAAEAAALTAPQ